MLRLGLVLLALTSAVPASASAPRPSARDLARGLSFLTKVGELAPAEFDRARQRLKLPADVATPQLRCGTALLVQARRWARELGLSLGGNGAAPADEFVGFVESSTLNLRVYYQSEAQRDEATRALAFAEQTWHQQVEEWGYPAPYTRTDTGPQKGLYLYMVPGGQGYAGLTRPQIDIPETPRCDCTVDVLIVSGMGDMHMKTTISHEFNHATQAATDCGETISAWEGFATAVEYELTDRNDNDTEYMISAFQGFPEYPLDYWTYPDGYSDPGAPTAYYQYGAALLPLFLRDRFGRDDPTLLRQVWDSFAQDGTYLVFGTGGYCDPGNDPDWLEGLDNFLRQHGSDLQSAFAEFSAWRAIVATRDDGFHFRKGRLFAAPRLKISTSSLPSGGSFELHEYGSRYLELMPSPRPPGIEVTLDCDATASWSASLLLWRDRLETERVALQFDGGKARGSLPTLAGIDRAMLVLSQHTDGTHSADDADYETTRTCSYTLSAFGDTDAGADSTPPAAAPGEGLPAGCGCGASGAAAPVGGLALLAALAARRRR